MLIEKFVGEMRKNKSQWREMRVYYLKISILNRKIFKGNK